MRAELAAAAAAMHGNGRRIHDAEKLHVAVEGRDAELAALTKTHTWQVAPHRWMELGSCSLRSCTADVRVAEDKVMETGCR